MFSINKIGLGNFRIFKEMTTFELSDLTILTGPNSSGKSSLTKALLLLDDNAKKNELEELDFISGSHSLGSFEFALNKNSIDDEMNFYIQFSENFLLANNILWLIVPYMTIRLRYVKFAETGRLHSIIFTNFDSSSNSEKIILMIQPFCVSKKHLDMGMEINLAYLLSKFKTEILRLSTEPLEDVVLIPGDIEKEEPVLLSMKDPLINGYAISQNVLEMADASVLNAEKIIGLLEGFSVKKINLFLRFLEDHVIEEYSQDYYSKNEWNKEDKLNRKDGFHFADYDEIYGEFEYASYKSILTRHFHENRAAQKTIKEINFEKQIVDWGKTNPNIKKIAYKKNDFKLYEDLIAIIGNNKLHEIVTPEFTNFNSFIENEFKKLFSEIMDSLNFPFLESVRANTQRLYTNQSQGTHFNELLLKLSRTELAPDKIQFINKWLKEFKIGDELKIERITGVATKVYILNKGESIELADLGYGVSQLLPILIKIAMDFNLLFWKDNGFHRFKTQNYPIMIIEEPETNLHPKFQSQLADMFVDAMNTFRVRFVIETHSEYLIRKIQYLVAAKKVLPIDISLYYFHEPENIPVGEKQVKKIEIQEDGSLSSEFGTGFFDEALNWKFELLKLKNKN